MGEEQKKRCRRIRWGNQEFVSMAITVTFSFHPFLELARHRAWLSQRWMSPMGVALLSCLRAHQHITRTPQEPLSSLVWETLPPALLGALSGVGYMFGGSQTNEDFKMWHVRARSLATLGLFIQGCTHTAETLPDLCSFSPAQSAGLTNTQFPTLIHVHKLSTEVVMKSNHNDIFPW